MPETDWNKINQFLLTAFGVAWASALFMRFSGIQYGSGESITIIANAALFVVAACLFVVIRRHYRLLEQDASQSRRELALRDLQLEKLTSALSGQARSEITAMNMTSRLLLENYGGFLPRQGHEYAEQMKQAAIEMERLRQDLVGSLGCERNGHAA